MGFLHRLASTLGGKLSSRWSKPFRGLSLVPGSWDARLAAWVESAKDETVLVGLPKAEVWALLGTPGSAHHNHQPKEGWNEAAAQSRTARWELYSKCTPEDAPALVRLGKVFAAAVGTVKVVRSAGPDLPDWLYLLVQDMVCIQGYLAGIDFSKVSPLVEERLPYLSAALLQAIGEAGDVEPAHLVRLVLDRQESDWGLSMDAWGSAVGMIRWVESLGPVFAEQCLRLGGPGRRNAAAAVGLWRTELLHSSLLARLVVDANKTVRTEAQRSFGKLPESLQESLMDQILSSGSAVERECAAGQLARIGSSEAARILRKAADTELPSKARLAVETALGTLETVRTASLDKLENPPAWTPYVILPLGDDVGALLEASYQRLLAKLEAGAEAEREANKKNKVGYSWQEHALKRMKSVFVGKLVRFLEVPVARGAKDEWPQEAIQVLENAKEVVLRPDFGVHRVLAALSLRSRQKFEFWHETLFQLWFSEQPKGSVDLRALARALGDLGLGIESIESACLARDWYGGDLPHEVLPPERVWPFFVEHPQLLDSRLGIGASRLSTWDSAEEARGKALDVLETHPAVPVHLIAPLLDLALGSAKTHRRRAQDILSKLPDIEDRISQAVENPSQEIRISAARWITRVSPSRARIVLAKRLAKETRESARASILSCLETLGEDISEALSEETLRKEAAKGLKGGIPAALSWFPVAGLPRCRFQDGTEVDRSLVEWWLVMAHRLKEPSANPLLVRYLSLLDVPSREGLGLYVLQSFIADDSRGPTLEEANAKAAKEGAQRLSQYQSWAKFPWGKEFLKFTLEMCMEAIRKEALATYLGSRIADKGILALCALAPGAKAVEIVRQFMKDHYTRRAQIEAILEALSVGGDPLVIQLILSVARRYRTPSVQEKARVLVEAIAERKNWSTDDLADRTIPTGGLDESGILVLDYGHRQFTASLDQAFKVVLRNAEGKELKALPDPNQSDDPQLAKEAKSLLQALKKGAKQVVELQTARLYEAMCSERTWQLDAWRELLQQHPIAGRLVRSLVWIDRNGRTFRPAEDGTLIDSDDRTVVLEEGALVGLAHGSRLEAPLREAWQAHVRDYKVKPLFPQMDRLLPKLEAGQTEIDTRMGWMSDTFTMRGLFAKRGYLREEAQDGGWFFHYRKDFLQSKVRVLMEFTGSGLPEENIPAALKVLRFERIQKRRYTALDVSEVPPVLLAEAYGDYLQVAEGCRGFDPDWERK